MNTWLKSLIAGLCVALLFFFLGDNLSGFKNKQKSTRIKYIIGVSQNDSSGKKVSENLLITTANMIQARISATGIKSTSSIVRQDPGGGPAIEIIIENVKDTQMTRELITSNGLIQFWEAYAVVEMRGFFAAADKASEFLYPPPPVEEITAAGKKDSVSSEIRQLLDSMEANKRRGQLQGISRYLNYQNIDHNGARFGDLLPKDSSVVGNIIRSPFVTEAIPADANYCFGAMPSFGQPQPAESKILSLYMLRTYGRGGHAILDNKDIAAASADFTEDGKPVVLFRFTGEGARVWEQLTQTNIGQSIAIVINGKVVSAPRVEEKIVGGETRLAGSFTIDECQSLAAQLKGMPLPVTVVIFSEQKVGNSSPVPARKWVFICIVFAVSYALAWFVFNTLTPT